MNKLGVKRGRGTDASGLTAASMDTMATLGTTTTLGPLLPHATVDATEATAGQISTDSRPSPANIVEYLPWACRQLNVDADVHVLKILES